jgi:hypothetical protein
VGNVCPHMWQVAISSSATCASHSAIQSSSESVPSTCSPHRSGRTRAHVWAPAPRASGVTSARRVGVVDSFVLEPSDPLIETPQGRRTRSGLRAVIPSAPFPPFPPDQPR